MKSLNSPAIILNPIYHLEKSNDKFSIIDNRGEEIGTLTESTKELIDYLNQRLPLNEICLIFSNKTQQTIDYVKKNMIKTLQFLLANQILVEIS